MLADEVDFIEAGQGDRVILIHSSVSGARQWRSLMGALASGAHVLAINLFGYGATRPWTADRPQTLEDQARLIEPFLPRDGGKISLVGHSFGGSVAMKAALLFKDQVRRLVLVEPNPFYLLDRHDRPEAYAEAVSLRDTIKAHGQVGSWETAAESFANYWAGAGSWDAMPEDRRSKFATALQPNFHEWDAVMNEQTSLSEWRAALPPDTTVVSAADTTNSISGIVEVLQENAPSWNYERVGQGGHMAIVSNPDLVNPIVIKGLR